MDEDLYNSSHQSLGKFNTMKIFSAEMFHDMHHILGMY